jgi:hypothetical protein
MALSVPAMADRNSQTTKATTTTVKVNVVKTTATSSATKSEFVRTGWKDGLRFYLHNWLGWPVIHIVDPKPSVPDEPRKSGTDPHSHWLDIAPIRDHGGYEDA